MPSLSFRFDAVTYKPNSLYIYSNSGESLSWNDYEEKELPFEFQIMTDYELNGQLFKEEVAVFEITARTGFLEPNTIVKFSYSKEIGLIFLELKSGIKYLRNQFKSAILA